MVIDKDKALLPETPNDGDGAGNPGHLRKHSLMIAGHRTSISLENAFWHALGHAARRRGESVTRLVTAIDARRTGNLSSAIRLFVLAELEDRLRIIQESGEKTPPWQ